MIKVSFKCDKCGNETYSISANDASQVSFFCIVCDSEEEWNWGE